MSVICDRSRLLSSFECNSSMFCFVTPVRNSCNFKHKITFIMYVSRFVCLLISKAANAWSQRRHATNKYSCTVLRMTKLNYTKAIMAFVVENRRNTEITTPNTLENKVIATIVIRPLDDPTGPVSTVVADLRPLGLGYVWGRRCVHSISRPWVPISSILTHIAYLLPFWGYLAGSKSCQNK